jgi:hypothetical protein
VIAGGESGHGARPLKKEWVRNIRRQCRKFKVPFFFKQWGGVRKSIAGRVLDGRTYDEFPAVRVNNAPVARRQRLTAISQIQVETPTTLGRLSLCSKATNSTVGGSRLGSSISCFENI